MLSTLLAQIVNGLILGSLVGLIALGHTMGGVERDAEAERLGHVVRRG